MINKIYSVWIYVKNLEESKEFYEKALGLKVKVQDKKWIEFDLGGTSFSIFERSKDKGPMKPAKTRIMFETEDIERTKDSLLRKNVKLIGDIKDKNYGKLLTFEDPNGHWLEIFERKKSSQ